MIWRVRRIWPPHRGIEIKRWVRGERHGDAESYIHNMRGWYSLTINRNQRQP
jgi:hypothetical protein